MGQRSFSVNQSKCTDLSSDENVSEIPFQILYHKYHLCCIKKTHKI